ncbi:MAG: T9SS type A sorting domain-containing protein [Chitinophagales bacterium]
MTLADNGDVWVASLYDFKVLRYSDAGGTPIGEIGTGTLGSADGQFDRGYDVSIAPNGDLWVIEQDGQRFQQFDSDGNFISKFGGTQGSGDGQFAWARGIHVDDSGFIWVSDSQNNRVQRFCCAPTNNPKWEVADIISNCNSASATYHVCYTALDLDGVIGVDIDFSYPDVLTPVNTDFITLKDKALEPVSGNASQIEVYTSTDVAGQVSASIYFDFSAPVDAVWTGEGEFICFAFETSNTWDGTTSTETIVTNSLVESYATGVGEESPDDASVELITMIGQIYVNGDTNLPLVNGINFNGTTEIMTADENCDDDNRWTQTFNTENDGEFSIAAAGSENLRITRNTSENDLSIIGGVDALRSVFIRLGFGDAPTLNELLAMDVNGDGFASSGDITNILRRAVGLIPDYPVQDGDVASDWKFAAAETMDVLEGQSHDWKNVPILSQCIPVPADPCAQVYEYDAILKGDVISNWLATSALKTALDLSLVVDVRNKAMLESEQTYRIPVYAKDNDGFSSLDLDLDFDATKVSIEDMVLTEVGESYDIQYVWNTPEEGRLMMASYTIQEIDTNEPLFEIVVKEDVNAEDFGVGKSFFNGIESDVEVTGTAVGIEDILGGSSSLTAIQSLQPNPANNVVMINYDSKLIGNLEVQIMDLAGKTVALQSADNTGETAMDVSQLQDGLYILTLSENGELKGRAKLMVAK